MPPAACASVAGAGMITASSAAREGATANAAMASAPIAAAQSERRLNERGDMVSSCGKRVGRQFRTGTGFRNRRVLLRCPRYARRRILLRLESHGFVNKA